MPDTTVTSADGTKLAARHSGDGSPLVLVHGANGDLDTFALIEAPLAERHSVWVYSRRGRGGSGDGPDYSLQKEVDDVLAVLAAAGDRAHLVGHSGGALYSLLAARQSPPLRSLVLYEPPLRVDRWDIDVINDVQAALDAGKTDHALDIFFAAVGGVESEVEVLRSLEPVWQRIREGHQRVPREMRLAPEERDRVMAFEPPDVATLYLYGEETDAPIFPTLEDVAERLPNAQFHGLPGQRHLAFAFDPTAFTQAILVFTAAHDD
jgi:pimeloyl-ACP methyl ester carboxylesterase